MKNQIQHTENNDEQVHDSGTAGEDIYNNVRTINQHKPQFGFKNNIAEIPMTGKYVYVPSDDDEYNKFQSSEQCTTDYYSKLAKECEEMEQRAQKVEEANKLLNESLNNPNAGIPVGCYLNTLDDFLCEINKKKYEELLSNNEGINQSQPAQKTYDMKNQIQNMNGYCQKNYLDNGEDEARDDLEKYQNKIPQNNAVITNPYKQPNSNEPYSIKQYTSSDDDDGFQPPKERDPKISDEEMYRRYKETMGRVDELLKNQREKVASYLFKP